MLEQSWIIAIWIENPVLNEKDNIEHKAHAPQRELGWVAQDGRPIMSESAIQEQLRQ